VSTPLWHRPPALLVLADGTAMPGYAYGALGTTVGEAVFCTAMTGYQETLTDPSYAGQVVVMTAPQIGNTGVNASDAESARIWVAGYVVRDPSPRASSWRAEGELEDALVDAGVVGIAGVDTRALTRHLRDAGAMGVAVSSTMTEAGALRAQLGAWPGMLGADLTGQVATTAAYVVAPRGEVRARVAAVDLGIKAMTPQRLAARGVEVTVVPATITEQELAGMGVDGLFLSNGPGDPATADHAVGLARWALATGLPLFGICFGHQVLGRALGLDTYKLPFGHRGINQPVADLATGRVEISAHNHGFAVAAPDDGRLDTVVGPARVTHRCLNDNVVEGLACEAVPAFSVQYHPEAAAGPHDSDYLFDRFVELMGTH